MDPLRPETPEEFAEALAGSARAGRSITVGGAFTKNGMAGPVAPADVTLSTASLNRVLQYDPRDLTISVEAGMRYGELTRIVTEHRQMLPLDPPFSEAATIGGVLAANTCGPRRRLYGVARDMVIGMKFATLEGKIVQSGGMVVKNVAGLDMAKLTIGSFGTLAAIVVANFKLAPMPEATRTFLLSFAGASEAAAARDAVLRSVLQPAAIDMLNPTAARLAGHDGFVLAVQAGGNSAVLDRYGRELPGAQSIEGSEETEFWRRVQDFTPAFLASHPEGAVVRVPATLAQLRDVFEMLSGPAVARAGTGICYGYFDSTAAAANWVQEACARGWRPVVEFAPDAEKAKLDLWPNPGSDFDIMKRVKEMFDPGSLLNRGRLYGRL